MSVNAPNGDVKICTLINKSVWIFCNLQWGYVLKYLCPGNPMDRRAWQTTVHGGHKKVRHGLVTKQQQRRYSTWHVFNTLTLLIAAAAAAKLLQSCPALCDPIDGSAPGSDIPGILQARTLEWVAISFSIAWKWKWSHSIVSGSLWPHGLHPFFPFNWTKCKS